MVSLVSFLDENARRQPDHLACVVGDDSLSYAELRDASCRFAGALTRRHLGEPSRSVVSLLPASPAAARQRPTRHGSRPSSRQHRPSGLDNRNNVTLMRL
jgi:hypothetical protein